MDVVLASRPRGKSLKLLQNPSTNSSVTSGRASMGGFLGRIEASSEV